MESKRNNKTLILLHLAVFLAGWTGIFGRLISLGGFLFLTLCIPAFVGFFPGSDIVPGRSDILWLILLGSVFTILPFLLQLHALRRLSAFTVNLAYNLEPVYSIAFAAILFGEQQELNGSFWLGISLIVVSVVVQTVRVRNRVQ